MKEKRSVLPNELKMNRSYFWILAGITLFISAILIALYALSPIGNTEIHRASFRRDILADSIISEIARLDLGYNSYYIAGATSDKIYLGNYTAPLHLVVTNRTITDTSHLELRIIGVDSVPGIKKFRTLIDSPYVFLVHGVLPGIFRGSLNELKVTRFMRDDAFFAQLVPVSASSFVLVSNSAENNEFELAKQTIDSPYFRFEHSLLERQVDGRFCVDGKLHFVRDLNVAVYLYYYRNQFIVSDTNLNLTYRGNTIDTFSTARIQIAEIGGGTSMLSTPPSRINGLSCVSDKYLFVQSNLLSQNGDVSKFRNGYIIDVYDLMDRAYKCSFYLNSRNSRTLSDFKVVDDQLISLYGSEIVLYSLDID